MYQAKLNFMAGKDSSGKKVHCKKGEEVKTDDATMQRLLKEGLVHKVKPVEEVIEEPQAEVESEEHKSKKHKK